MTTGEPKEGGDIGPAGSIRDLTRRHGILRPVWGLFSLDEAGKLWVPEDSSSVSAMLEHGVRRPSLEEIMGLIHWQAQQNRTPNPGDVETRKAVIADVISIIAPSSRTIFRQNCTSPRLDVLVPQTQGDFIRLSPRKGVNQHTRVSSDQVNSTEVSDGRDMRWMAAMAPVGHQVTCIFQDGFNGKIGVYYRDSRGECYDFSEDEDRTLVELETYMGSIYYPGSSQDIYPYPIDPKVPFFETIPYEQLRP